MRLNPRSVALAFLQDKYPINFCVSDRTEATELAFEFIRHQFPLSRNDFKSKVQLITAPFHEAFQRAFDKLIEHLIEKPLHEVGTMIHPGGKGQALTLFYDVHVKLHQDSTFSVSGNAFGFANGDYPGPRLTVFLSLKDDQGMAFSPESNCDEEKVKALVVRAALMRQFMRLCEVETKFIEPGKKAHSDGEKYRNETKITIEVVSCTMFTNVVRAAGFWVGKETGGFFRRQPCGPGLKSFRFVWIKPFEKSGYTIKAKALHAGAVAPLTTEPGDIRTPQSDSR